MNGTVFCVQIDPGTHDDHAKVILHKNEVPEMFQNILRCFMGSIYKKGFLFFSFGLQCKRVVSSLADHGRRILPLKKIASILWVSSNKGTFGSHRSMIHDGEKSDVRS